MKCEDCGRSLACGYVLLYGHGARLGQEDDSLPYEAVLRCGTCHAHELALSVREGMTEADARQECWRVDAAFAERLAWAELGEGEWSREDDPPRFVTDRATWERAKAAARPQWSDYVQPWAVVVATYDELGGVFR